VSDPTHDDFATARSGARAGKRSAPRAEGERSPAEREPRLLNVGYGNMVMRSRIVAVVSSQSSASRRLRDEAEHRNLLVDATQGRRTRSILVMDTGHVVMSAVNPETVSARIEGGEVELA
jgi:regulator of extracellular matrix RemA (YlzA/DUF370 family)